MLRRRLTSLVFAALYAACGGGARGNLERTAAKRGPARPNLVVLIADQFRGMAMSCAGEKNVSTRNLDRMASEGVRFARAYANCPVCVPSRACLLTGRYPFSTHVIAN